MEGWLLVTEATEQLSPVVGVPRATAVAVQAVLVVVAILAGAVIVGLVVSIMLKVLVSTLVANEVVVISNETRYSPGKSGVNEVDVVIVVSIKLPEFMIVVNPFGSLTFHW